MKRPSVCALLLLVCVSAFATDYGSTSHARTGAGFNTSGDGQFGYDVTAKNWHFWMNGADAIAPFLPASITPNNNDCVKWSVSAGAFSLNTAGGACGALILTTKGDIYTFSTTAARLAVGADGACLQADSSQATGLNWLSCSTSIIPNAQTGTTYTVLTGDRGKYLSFSNASAIAVTLPQAGSSGFGSNFTFTACSIGAGTATITPTTSTISYTSGNAYTSAASSMTLSTGQCAFIYSDNTNYFAIKVSSGSGGVTSWSGDGALFTNSASTGAVTGALANAAAYKFWGNDTSSTAAPGYKSIPTAALPSAARTRAISFTIGDPAGSALASGSTSTDYITVPFACTISAYNLVVDAGTITVKFWKVATGTAIPTSSNSISTSGVGISTGTAIHSTTVSDFTSTSVSANDIMAMNITAVSTAKYVNGVLECAQ